MLHVGVPDFFQRVYADALVHDTVLIEGVRAPIVQRITQSYRWIEGSKKINLIVQPPYPSQVGSHARIVHADLASEEFTKVWLKVPLRVCTVVYFAAPVMGAGRRWFGTRKTLAKGMTLDDLADRRETLDLRPETIALTQAILHARDVRLVERLGEQLDDPIPELRRLAIVYGAHHMRAALRELTRQRGYHVERSEWLTVFPI